MSLPSIASLLAVGAVPLLAGMMLTSSFSTAYAHRQRVGREDKVLDGAQQRLLLAKAALERARADLAETGLGVDRACLWGDRVEALRQEVEVAGVALAKARAEEVRFGRQVRVLANAVAVFEERLSKESPCPEDVPADVVADLFLLESFRPASSLRTLFEAWRVMPEALEPFRSEIAIMHAWVTNPENIDPLVAPSRPESVSDGEISEGEDGEDGVDKDESVDLEPVDDEPDTTP